MSANGQWVRKGGHLFLRLILAVGVVGAVIGCPAPGPQAPVVASFVVNGNAATTPSETVTLASACAHAPTEYLAAETPDFAGAAWLPYAAQVTFTLSAGVGEKTVHFKVRNTVGESAAISDTIALAPPTSPAITSFALNGGAASTPHAHVTLNASCEGGPTEYLASEAPDFAGASWQPYVSAPAFTLSEGLGVKTVHYKVRNAFGETAAVSDQIERVEQLTPEVTAFAVNQGAQRTVTRAVTLDNTATGAPTEYLASESAAFAGAAWQPYAAAPTFTLSPGMGVKTVYLKTRNTHGESPAVSDQIERTTSSIPEVTGLAINAGAAFSADATVTLDNTCANGPTEYLAAETPDFAGAAWSPYSAAPAFELTAGEGLRTVYLKVRNAYGESNVLSDTITLGTPAPPVVTSFALNNGEASAASRLATLNSACTGIPTEYLASESPAFEAAIWRPYSATAEFELSGGNWAKTVYFKTRNSLGESDVVHDTIILQAPPTVTSFAIKNGESSTVYREVTLNSSCTDSPSELIASESPSFSGAVWQLYSAEHSFELSSGYGLKTVYFKTRNAHGESGTVSDSIEFESTGFVFDCMMPKLRQPWYFNTPADVAVDTSGNVYVCDTHNHRIQKLTSDGTFLKQWGRLGNGRGEFDTPQGLGVDLAGNVYIADTQNHRVEKYASDGTFLSHITTNNLTATPVDVAIDADGNVYVLDFVGRVQKFTPAGVLSIAYGAPGCGNGEFYNPSKLAVTPSGTVFVADGENNRIQKFSSDGAFLLAWKMVQVDDHEYDLVTGIALDNLGNVYAKNRMTAHIQKYDSNGIFLGMWSTTRCTVAAGYMGSSRPAGLAVDSLGYVYDATASAHQIRRFSSDGNLIDVWGNAWPDYEFPNQLGRPGHATQIIGPDMAIDSAGNVYVLNDMRIVKFSSDGTFLAAPVPGNCLKPYALLIDHLDNLYVADWERKCILKCDPSLNGIIWAGREMYDNNMQYPCGLAMDGSGKIYVARYHFVQKFSESGQLLAQFGSGGLGDDQMVWVQSIAVDAQGNLFAADDYLRRIQKFSPDGRLLTKWGSEGTGDGQFTGLISLALGTSGHVYVTDSEIDRIQEFASDGTFIRKWGSTGSKPGQFVTATNIKVDAYGDLYVLEHGNRRVQKFGLE